MTTYPANWIGVAFHGRDEVAAVSPLFKTEEEATTWCCNRDHESGGNLSFRVWSARELFDGAMGIVLGRQA